ncbi:MAG: glycerol-3-phosphate acyltransferase [Candidatus Saccharimonadales bacterium]|jgi:acyl phosphate:glycerol-3-phosphate acyltransferase
MLTIILIFLIAYLLGSIPFGKIIGLKFYGIDIQKRGSGNIGFANVLTHLGWKAAIPTLLGDVSKGALATWLALHYLTPELAYWAGITAVLAHIFPIWLNFRGGKGIATAFGVMLVLAPLAAVIGLGIYLLPYLGFKIESGRAAIMALATLTIVGQFVSPLAWWQFGCILLIALWTLRDNIRGTIPNM